MTNWICNESNIQLIRTGTQNHKKLEEKKLYKRHTKKNNDKNN